MNIYLIRHGRQSSPLCNVNVDLSIEGREQVELLAKRLKDIPFDTLYSSDLIRAIQTAKMINEYHHLPHEIRESLREIDFGDWTGMEDSVIATQYKEFIARNKLLLEDLPYPGGESGNDVIKRAMPTIKEIIDSDHENVLVVTHGGVIRSLAAYLLGMDLSKKGLFGIALEHTSITELHYDKKQQRFYLQRFNDHAHLEGHAKLMRNHWKK